MLKFTVLCRTISFLALIFKDGFTKKFVQIKVIYPFNIKYTVIFEWRRPYFMYSAAGKFKS
jgi:hypothetical protein